MRRWYKKYMDDIYVNQSHHVMMIVNDTNFVWNLRREVLEAIVREGYRVTLVTEILDFKEQIEKIGCRIINVSTGRHGTNPLDDIRLFWKYYTILKEEQPDIVLTNNIKPNVYAGMACRLLKIKYMTNICGLGTPVENKGRLQRLTIVLYKIGIKGASALFFQNHENKAFFETKNMMPQNAKVIVTPGSGVNLEAHPILPWPEDGPIHFLYAARIMKEKGIDLVLETARKYASTDIIFDICGQCDDPEYTNILNNEKSIVYHGLQNDLQPFYAKCSCFLYPSYYPEGMSNVLLEAAASGRPVIATDRAGCRETLTDGITGFLVPINNIDAVIDAVDKITKMSPVERYKMGQCGRKKMIQEFDREIVVSYFMREIQFQLAGTPNLMEK